MVPRTALDTLLFVHTKKTLILQETKYHFTLREERPLYICFINQKRHLRRIESQRLGDQ